MRPREAVDRLARALARGGAASSDFDLDGVSLDGPKLDGPKLDGAAPPRALRPAAVLLAVDLSGEAARVVLTVRAAHLRHHGGQVALPGGKMDAGDPSPEACALREAREGLS